MNQAPQLLCSPQQPRLRKGQDPREVTAALGPSFFIFKIRGLSHTILRFPEALGFFQRTLLTFWEDLRLKDTFFISQTLLT